MTTNLPATLLEAEAIDTIAHNWIDRVADLMTSEAARLSLRNHIKQMVRQGTIPTMQVIAAARAGFDEGDQALRQLAVEMLDRGELPGAALRAYAQEALLRPPVTPPPGRNAVDTWRRDIGIGVLVFLTKTRWNVPISRNPASKKSGRLSACYLVSEALVKRGIMVSERRVEKIYAAPNQIAERLSALLPPI